MYIVLHVCSHVILHTIIFMTVLIDGDGREPLWP